LPAERIHHRPLFIADPGMQKAGPGDYALYLGRLAKEKGIRTVLEAWRNLDIPLKIRGSGPLEAEVREFAQGRSNIEILPRLSHEEKYRLIRGARFLVWPSIGYYETFGLVVADAYASGVPLIASRTGVATEMVVEGKTGLFFEQLDTDGLAQRARWAWEHPEEMAEMGRNGRDLYESRFSLDVAYENIMTAYAAAGGGKAARVAAAGAVPVAPHS
jgi:glycosyltransferase involved in cell wall biosynthesis